MAHETDLARIPLIPPGTGDGELKPLYEEAVRQWGNVPRYLQLMAHVPAGVAAWLLLDRELRLRHLPEEAEYVSLQELAIVKTSLINQCVY